MTSILVVPSEKDQTTDPGHVRNTNPGTMRDECVKPINVGQCGCVRRWVRNKNRINEKDMHIPHLSSGGCISFYYYHHIYVSIINRCDGIMEGYDGIITSYDVIFHCYDGNQPDSDGIIAQVVERQ